MSKANPHIAGITFNKALLLYFVVSGFLFFEMAVQVSPSVMAGQLMHDLDINAFHLGLMSGFYFYTYTIMQIPSGLLFDRYNPRLIICAAIMGCVIGTMCFAMADNIYLGCLGRLLTGFGSAFAFVAVLVVTADLFHTKHFALMTGITQMLGALGAMSGQLPLSTLTNEVGWRMTLFILATIGSLLALLIFLMLRYEKPYHIMHAKCREQLELPSIGEQLSAIIRSPQTWIVAVYAMLMWAPMSGFASLWGVGYLQQVDNLSNKDAAFTCSMMWLGLAFFSPILGWFSTKINNRKFPLYISALLGGIAFFTLVYFELSPWLLSFLLFIAGGACAGQALSFTVVKENNSKEWQASAIAFNNMAVVISGAIFQPLIGKLLESVDPGKLIHGHRVFPAYAYTHAMWVIVGAYLIAFLTALWLLREPRISDT